MKDIIIGQEAICPDGLGRVIGVEKGIHDITFIRIDTYYNNRSCEWNPNSVELIDPRAGNLNVEEITETMGELSITTKKAKHEKAFVIMCNGYPELVVLDDEEKAVTQMNDLRQKHFQSNQENFIDEESYRIRYIWDFVAKKVS